MASIEKQIAVVTGAGRGIGRAIAIELGKLGANVVLASRNRSELEETAQIIGAFLVLDRCVARAIAEPLSVGGDLQTHRVVDTRASSLASLGC